MPRTTEAVHAKLDIALEYLDLAMQLYMENRNYFCTIHLAAAAEELLGKHLPESACIYNMALKAQKALKILESGHEPENLEMAHKEAKSVLLSSKNAIKHMNDAETTISIDSASEAAYWIEQALINFYKLKLRKSQTLWKFEDYRNEQMRQELGSLL